VTTAEFNRYLKSLPTKYTKLSLEIMLSKLRPDLRQPLQKNLPARIVGKALGDSSRIWAVFESISETQRSILILVDRADEFGMNLDLLRNGIRVLEGRDESPAIFDLFARGLLLPVSSNTEWSLSSPAIAFDLLHLEHVVIRNHPFLDPFLKGSPLPDELPAWPEGGRDDGPVEISLSVSPRKVIETLSDVCDIIDHNPNFLTKRGQIRAPVRKEIADAGFDELGFKLWAEMARRFSFIQRDRDGFWHRKHPASILGSEPLVAISLLPEVLTVTSPGVFDIDPVATFVFGGLEYQPMGDARVFSLNLLKAAIEGLHRMAAFGSGLWFKDEDLRPLLRPTIRAWINMLFASYYMLPWHVSSVSDLINQVDPLTRETFHVLALFGLIERGLQKGKAVSRLSEIGAWVLQHGMTYVKNRDVIAGLEGELSWDGDLLKISDMRDTYLVQLALGDLARPVGNGSFRIDGEGARMVASGGVKAKLIIHRIDTLVPQGAPISVKGMVEEALRTFHPVILNTGLSAVLLSELKPALLKKLRSFGHVVGEVILFDSDGLRRLQKLASIRNTIDYDSPPRPSCLLSADLSISRKKGVPYDLRLRQLFEDYGMECDASQFQLDVEKMGLFDLESDDMIQRRLKYFLSLFEAHVIDGISDVACMRIMALAGIVDAPRVNPHVVLEFEPVIARGLIEGGVLGEKVNYLRDGLILVPQQELTRVEEALSKLGIPFPAEASSLLESGRGRIAVERLEEAITGVSLQPAAVVPRPEERRRRSLSPSEEEIALVLSSIQTNSDSGGRGATLGELSRTTGLENQLLHKILRSLLNQGKLTLSGHARGARYKIP